MLLGMVEATIEDLAFLSCSSKEHDGVRRRGCIEHIFGKEVRLGFNRGHLFSDPKQTCAVPQPLRRTVREWR
jgi:hypothetical protein